MNPVVVWMKWPHGLIGTSTIRRCGLAGAGVAPLKEVCHWRWVLRSPMLKLHLVWLIHFLLSVDPDVVLEANSPTSCLPIFYYVSRHDDNGLNF